MNIDKIIEELKMQPHPEGGFYSETYKSELSVEGQNRKLMTVIYFLLSNENVSRFHRIKSDEFWFYHGGCPLTVHTLTEEEGHTEYKVGMNFGEGQKPQLLVPKNTIFGSSVDEEGYALVSCAVAPGFEFEDFELFSKADLMVDFSEHESIINRLT